MRYLLDTNTFFWAMTAPRELSGRSRRICESRSAVRLVSVISLWELLGKCSTGKLTIRDASSVLPSWVSALEMEVLSITAAHAYALYDLPLLHKDPFDRMLIAQAVVEDLTLVTPDENIHRYPSLSWAW